MVYEDRKIVKKFQVAVRRLTSRSKLSDNHFISKYIKKEELTKKIESHFLPGMNWENHAKIWEISHLIPVVYFDQTNEEDLKFCWNVKNIIPLFKEDNKNFGSCLYFAKHWFETNKDKEDYTEYINFVENKMGVYSKYMIK